MTQERWSAVDAYYEQIFHHADPRFDAILAFSAEKGLPAIQVSPNLGKFLELQARFQGAGRILEIGTLGGYSTAWLAQGMSPDGRLVTLELEPVYAQVAKENLSRFDFADAIDITVGDATESLRALADSGEEPFDLIFIDADKTQYADYLEGAIRLSRPGTMIIADNIVRKGEVIDEQSEDPSVIGVQAFNRKVAEHPALHATVIQTVGVKGYDGFCLIHVARDETVTSITQG